MAILLALAAIVDVLKAFTKPPPLRNDSCLALHVVRDPQCHALHHPKSCAANAERDDLRNRVSDRAIMLTVGTAIALTRHGARP
jgi:hypothetical protein